MLKLKGKQRAAELRRLLKTKLHSEKKTERTRSTDPLNTNHSRGGYKARPRSKTMHNKCLFR